MRNRIILFVLFSFVYCNGKTQLPIEMIDEIIKLRSDYIADSIPKKFFRDYEPFIYSNDQQFYDSLKTILSEIPFSGKTFYWYEYFCLETHTRRFEYWTDDGFMVTYYSGKVALWPILGENTYKVEIQSNLKKDLINEFAIDFEEWNENITNRSYGYSYAAGSGPILCSKVTFDKSNQLEIKHTAFRFYVKDYPFILLKEQSEDDYKTRCQVNCDWITEDRLEEVVWGLIGVYKERGYKVFDCEGNEIEYE